MYKSVTDSILERTATWKGKDVFLSHSFADKDLVYGAARFLEKYGYTVYIDWRDDGNLDRSAVTKATAAVLRERMRSCKSLIYAYTQGAATSKWMPWELGFKDGQNTRAAIMPLAQLSYSSFSGQEYLTVYPYLTERLVNGIKRLYIQFSEEICVSFGSWLQGVDPSA